MPRGLCFPTCDLRGTWDAGQREHLRERAGRSRDAVGRPLGPVRALSLAVRPGPGPGRALPPCLRGWGLGSSPGVSPTRWCVTSGGVSLVTVRPSLGTAVTRSAWDSRSSSALWLYHPFKGGIRLSDRPKPF